MADVPRPPAGSPRAAWRDLRILPAWLRRYDRADLRGDLPAGVTVAAYLVPQVMAYAQIAGMPPAAGLWAAVAALLVYAVVGSSRQLSVGPESTTALMTAAALAPLAAGDSSRYAALAALLAALVGVICLAAWALRLGFLADLLSRPVLVGYLAGVAVVMMVGQLGRVTRLKVEGGSVGAQVQSFLERAGDTHLPTLGLAAGVLAFLLALHARWPRAPIPLFAVVGAAAVVGVFDLGGHGIAVVGGIPAGPPSLGLHGIGWSDVVALSAPAVGLAVVGYSDNILTARAFSGRSREAIDANRELLALGAANIGAGTVGGFPVSSSGSRTALGDAVGSRTQLHSVVAAGTVLVVVVALRPVLAEFPVAALGALVVYAAIRLVEVGEFRRLAGFRRSEALLAVATLSAVLVLGVRDGILAAVLLSLTDLLRRVARPHAAVLGYAPGLAGMHDIEDYPAAQIPGLVVFRYDSPLFFANAGDFRHRALHAVERAPTPPEWLLLNAEAIVDIDITASDALDELRAVLAERGVVLALARVKQELREQLDVAGIVARVGPERIFPTLPTAVRGYVAWYTERHGSAPALPDGAPGP